jgi:hypothetical protein
MLPQVPGIIEGTMTINPEPDGRLSLRVLIGAASGRTRESDLLELIISPEDLGRALAGQPAKSIEPALEFPCHIGFCRSDVDDMA